jgi:transposase InsO family protein
MFPPRVLRAKSGEAAGRGIRRSANTPDGALNRGKQTAFERALSKLGIRRKLIRPFTPRHNGKVERSHRKDNERFYALDSFSSLNDFKQKLKADTIKDYNRFPMRSLNWKSPQQVLLDFLRNDSVIYVCQTYKSMIFLKKLIPAAPLTFRSKLCYNPFYLR